MRRTPPNSSVACMWLCQIAVQEFNLPYMYDKCIELLRRSTIQLAYTYEIIEKRWLPEWLNLSQRPKGEFRIKLVYMHGGFKSNITKEELLIEFKHDKNWLTMRHLAIRCGRELYNVDLHCPMLQQINGLDWIGCNTNVQESRQ